jgi:GTP cyclohydrolase II
MKIDRKVNARIPTAAGEFQLFLYTSDQDDKEQLALVLGDVRDKGNVLVRVHSECFTGDVLGSKRCDCGEQLSQSIQAIAQKGEGILIYLRQEGRGIGLLNKLKAYNLQDIGYDTVDANLALGHQADGREYSLAAQILADLRVSSVELLTNNPHKIEHLKKSGISVTRRLPLETTVTADNAPYLLTKAQRMNHLLRLDPLAIMEERKGNGSKNGAH